MRLTPAQRIIFTALALAGLFGPNAVLLYHAVFRWPEFVAALTHPVPLTLLVDVLTATLLLAWLIARRPTGRWGWRTFVTMSLLGGLGFSISAFLLINSQSPATGDPAPEYSLKVPPM